MINWLKSAGLWIYQYVVKIMVNWALEPKNIKFIFRLLTYTKLYKQFVDKFVNHGDNGEMLALLAKTFAEKTESFSIDDTKKEAEYVTDAHGSIKSLKVDVDDKNVIKMSAFGLEGSYDPKTGKKKWGLEIPFII